MPNIGRLLRRTIRPLWIAGLGAAAWSNRTKVQEALGHKSATVPGEGESVTLRTTVATWTKPLRGRQRSTTVPAPSSSLPADMTAEFTEPTVVVPAPLTNSSRVSEEV